MGLGTIPTIVVDDHHHVLEPIHKAMRKRLLPFSNWSLVHIDAHPDMAFPRTIPADSIFTPHEFYDELEACDGAIASFLMPLVYAGHMSSLMWIKPAWARQMHLGDENFYVGKHVETGALCVSSRQVYFVDETMYADESALVKPQLLRFSVCDLECAPPTNPPSDPFVLDICLDYFSTLNPFLDAFQAACGQEDTRILQRIYSDLQFKNIPATLSHDQQITQQQQFTKCLDELFQDKLWEITDDEAQLLDWAKPILDLYNDPSSMNNVFLGFFRMLKRYNAEEMELLQWAGPCVDLPANVNANVKPMLASLRAYLSSTDCRPRLITIATSQGDAYTPLDQVDAILQDTLAMLEELYGPLQVENCIL
ncbi:unnamed protein product [Aphanomyces euteiches]